MPHQQTSSLDKIEINFATENDLPQLVELLSELFSIESDLTPDREKQLQGLRLILHTPASGRLFVLRVGGNLAGMANALFTVSTAEGGLVLLLEDVIVDRKFRGRGLGRHLVEHVLNWARGNGFARVTLLADQDNHPALNFYHKMGFKVSNMKVLRTKL
jgi:ribosomal protein S18 acetylase RimI-like enzyme